MWYTFVKTIWWERWKNQELTYWKYDDHQLRQQDLATQQQWWSWNSKFYYYFSKCTFFWSDFILTDFFAYLSPKIVLRIHLFKRHDLKNYRKSQKKKLRRDRTSKTVSLNSVWDLLLKRNEWMLREVLIFTLEVLGLVLRGARWLAISDVNYKNQQKRGVTGLTWIQVRFE